MCNCKCRGAVSSTGARGPIGATGPAGPAGTIGYKSVNNTVFVDQEFGNDSTGTRERLDLPYQTITAAQTAAASGDTIHVFPGTYTDYELGKSGVTFYFSLGANITVAATDKDIFVNSGDYNMDVFGYGRFQSTGALLLVSSTIDMKVINIEGISAIVSNGSTNGTCLIETTATGTCTINLNFVEKLRSSHSNLILTDTTTATINVTSPNISSAGAVSNYVSDNASVITINGPVTQTGTPYSYTYTYDGLFRTAASQSLILNENCTTVGTSLNNGSAFINGNITMGTATTEVITHSGVLLYVKGRIKSSVNNANSHCLNISASTKTILDNAKFVCTHANALSIYTTLAKNVILYSAYANRNTTAALVTNIITGTTLYVDSDVE